MLIEMINYFIFFFWLVLRNVGFVKVGFFEYVFILDF